VRRTKRGRTKVIQPIQPGSGRLSIPEGQYVPFPEQQISFRFECCSSKYCFEKISDRAERLGFAKTIHKLCSLTWDAINKTSRRSFGYETLDNLEDRCRNRPPGTRIIGFRYHDNHRMIGYKDSHGVFHVLLFDYKGDLYDHS